MATDTVTLEGATGGVVPGVVEKVQGTLHLEDLFPGVEHAPARHEILTKGYVSSANGNRRLNVRTVPDGDKHRIMAIAAVSRDPGLSDTYLDTVQDFLPTASGGNRARTLEKLWKIYESEGLVHNAINKIAAILSGGGRFKVRHVRKGKKQNAVEELQAALDEFRRKVNNSPLDGVVTGDRGLQMVTHQAVRSALVEGDWIGRTMFVEHEVPGFKTWSLPMIIQSLPMTEIEAHTDLGSSGIQQFYWVPPRAFIDKLVKPPKELRQQFKRLVPNDILNQLRKDGRALLDPALLLHVKHRGVAYRTFGESFITPARSSIAFKRAVEALDFVTMQSIINRITVVMVGSADPASPYSKADVALARTALMQSFFDEAGPNMTIIWEGNDVDIKTVGAHEDVLSLTDRHKLAAERVKQDLGVPDALLSGVTTDGKSAGWAAVIGVSAELEELQHNCANVWAQVGERIAIENGFTDIDLVFEFDKSLLVDKAEERNQARNDYITGTMSIRSNILARGGDPDAEFYQMCKEKGLDPTTAKWTEAFAPPQGMQGQGEGKVPGNGRTTDSEGGRTTTRQPERKSPTENK